MAKLEGPLFSFGAKGTIGNQLTIRNKNKTHEALIYNKPGDKAYFESSPKQKDQRGIIGLITIYWQCMSDLTKIAWEKEARTKNFRGTGYHYFLHLAKTNLLYYIGLAGYWSFNYNVGNQVYDLSGNNNHGTLKPSYPTNCPVPADSINSNFGKALSFNGLNDNVFVPDSNSLDLTTLSISFWCMRIKNNDWQCILGKPGDGISKNENYSAWYHPANFVSFYFGNGITHYTVSSSILNNNWHFLVCTIISNSFIRLYIDGLLYSETTGTTIIPLINSLPLSICSVNVGGYYFGGLIDELRIWNRELGPTEVLKHYNLFR